MNSQSKKVSTWTPFFIGKTALKSSLMAFSVVELMVVIIMISIIITLAIPKQTTTKLDLATDKIKLYLHYIRYIALVDNKYDKDDDEWQKKFWSLKFQKCSKAQDGLYFVVFADESGGTGAFKKKDTLKDPLNNKYLYSNYQCKPKKNESRSILLTKEYGINKVVLSCNTTSTIGQISFDHNGAIYSQLGMNIKKITSPCILTLYDFSNHNRQIIIEPETGYIH